MITVKDPSPVQVCNNSLLQGKSSEYEWHGDENSKILYPVTLPSGVPAVCENIL